MATELSPAKLYERAEKAARLIRARTDAGMPVAIVLGSGLGAFADELTDSTSIRYDEIPSFARATVEGHAGRLVIGKTNIVTVAAMQGRFHFYEGYSLEEVTFPIRVLKLLGVRTIIRTNAVGSFNTEFTPGSLLLITAYINHNGVNPLIGPNHDR